MDKVQEIMELVEQFAALKHAWEHSECKTSELESSRDSIESALRELVEQQQKDSTDAECFRWWVHEAAANPALVAKAIAHCITEDEYRAVIVGAKVAKDAAIKAATKGA